MPANRCIYTSLVGRYEALNEQPVAASSQFRFICLTDDPELTSTSWECRLVRPAFAMDPIRSQRFFKLLPHVHLPEFDGSIYIDNSIVLAEPPEAIWPLLPPGAGLAMPRHSFRATVLDEFLEVVQLGMDDPGRIFEQLNHYALTCPEVLQEAPWWSAIMLRDHRDRRVQQAMQTWLAHLLRYARRDQLSINLALREAALQPVALLIDNHQSWFHRWPVAHGRDRNRGPRNPITNLAPLAARVHALQRQLDQPHPAEAEAALLRTQLESLREELAALADANRALAARGHALQHQLNQPHPAEAEAATLRARLEALSAQLVSSRGELALLRGSTSWRATAPIRRIVDRARAMAGRDAGPG